MKEAEDIGSCAVLEAILGRGGGTGPKESVDMVQMLLA